MSKIFVQKLLIREIKFRENFFPFFLLTDDDIAGPNLIIPTSQNMLQDDATPLQQQQQQQQHIETTELPTITPPTNVQTKGTSRK